MSKIIDRRHIEGLMFQDLVFDRIKGFNDKINLMTMVDIGSHGHATEELPILYTSGLCTCTALYAYSGNFAYLNHMQTFQVDSNRPICTYEVDRLSSFILANKSLCSGTFNIGLVYGIYKEDNAESKLKLIEHDFNRLGDILTRTGINVVKDDERRGYGVIIDTSEPRVVVSPIKYDDDRYSRRV